MKKRNILVYALLAISTGAAVFLGIQNNTLQQQIKANTKAQENLNVFVNRSKKLLEIDSIVMQGDYRKAIDSYTSTMENSKELNMGIPLRIALAQKLMQNDVNQRMALKNDSLLSDSLSEGSVSPAELRRVDSLNFALEKARVQLGNMRNQLKQKSFGEYINFTSTKGTKLHYVGQVKNNMANGTGIALLETGSRYEGEWKDNKREGTGTFYWPDGEYYVGSYSNDMRNGQGSYFWPNGDKYVGEWKADKRNGEGTFYDKEGAVITRGIWADDTLKEEDKGNKG
ncbi:MAG: hypothetical protein WA810_02340 [Maribacter sp.]